MSKIKKYAMSSELVGIREFTYGKMKRRKLLRHSKLFLKTINRVMPQILCPFAAITKIMFK